MKIFNYQQTSANLPYPKLIDNLRHYFQIENKVPLRHIHTLKNTDEANAMLLIKPAWTNENFAGCKLLSLTP